MKSTTQAPAKFILTLNAGSSSLKFSLYDCTASMACVASGKIDGLGQSGAVLTTKTLSTGKTTRTGVDTAKPTDGLEAVLKAIGTIASTDDLAAAGHRVVHGGTYYTAPARVSPAMLEKLRQLSPLDPEHLPAEIGIIEALQKRCPGLPQIACFDTAFHHDLPVEARLLPIPRRYAKAGLRRFGFHGLSYQFLLEELDRLGDPAARKGRVILAHLGNGASMAAVRDGRSIDTSMSFTPAAGLVMSTRCGDLDPGVGGYLARTEKMTAPQFQHLVNHESGLLGISGISADMRVLLEKEVGEPHAAEAVAVFCYQARKWVGAYAAALGGLDTLVFAGGIGENCPSIRRRICADLGFLGIGLDEKSNASGASLISNRESRVAVRVIRTDEELMIARSVAAQLGQAHPGG